MYLALKVLISAVIIVLIGEIAKRSTTFGALVASLPLTSILALIWLYRDTSDTMLIATLSREIFWLVLPSLVLFLVLPLLLKRGMSFYAALGIASGCTALSYVAMSALLRRFGAQALGA
jgi:hypothetical protein